MEGRIPSSQQWEAKWQRPVLIVHHYLAGSFLYISFKSTLNSTNGCLDFPQQFSPDHGVPRPVHLLPVQFRGLPSQRSSLRLLTAQISTQPPVPRRILLLPWVVTPGLQRGAEGDQAYTEARGAPYRMPHWECHSHCRVKPLNNMEYHNSPVRILSSFLTSAVAQGLSCP